MRLVSIIARVDEHAPCSKVDAHQCEWWTGELHELHQAIPLLGRQVHLSWHVSQCMVGRHLKPT